MTTGRPKDEFTSRACATERHDECSPLNHVGSKCGCLCHTRVAFDIHAEHK